MTARGAQVVRRTASINAADDADAELTIDELAHASGVTVRNIRAHQSRGLLPPPQVRGRTGYYGQEHVARLQLISQMQADGFNLNAIKRILDGMPPGSAGEILGFERALRAPWGDEEPEIFEAHDLAELAGPHADEAIARKAIKLGIMVPLGDGRFEIPSPTLLRAGAELEKLGIDISARMAVSEQVKHHTEGVAAAFVRLFLEQVWKPFHDAGRPESDWPRIRATFDRLRPLASEVLLATFNQSMNKAVDQAFGKVMQQEVKAPPRSPKSDQAGSPRPGRRHRR